MFTYLDKILVTTRAAVAAKREQTPLAELERAAARHNPRGWAKSLRVASGSGPAIIAELKKASPSKGLIRADFDISWLAERYAVGGAAALSVLTDEPYFQGSLRNLELASAATHLPCLRKDFTVDEYQITEARAHHADAILIIAAALTDDEIASFTRRAHELSLDVLTEVHSAEELDRVLSVAEAANAAPDAIGVNNRDLRTFQVRLETSIELASRIPSACIRVSESGIAASSEVARLHAAGFDAFLIGESLMRQPDPAIALRDLLAGVGMSATATKS